MLGGAVVFLVVYGFLFRRGALDTRLWDSPVRVVVIALLGVALGWLVYRMDSRPR
jgi:NhaP-type Na+/H+ or K+/H+ antiporter